VAPVETEAIVTRKSTSSSQGHSDRKTTRFSISSDEQVIEIEGDETDKEKSTYFFSHNRISFSNEESLTSSKSQEHDVEEEEEASEGGQQGAAIAKQKNQSIHEKKRKRRTSLKLCEDNLFRENNNSDNEGKHKRSKHHSKKARVVHRRKLSFYEKSLSHSSHSTSASSNAQEIF